MTKKAVQMARRYKPSPGRLEAVLEAEGQGDPGDSGTKEEARRRDPDPDDLTEPETNPRRRQEDVKRTGNRSNSKTLYVLS